MTEGDAFENAAFLIYQYMIQGALRFFYNMSELQNRIVQVLFEVRRN